MADVYLSQGVTNHDWLHTGSYVRLSLCESVIVLELNDPTRFNSMTPMLANDICIALKYVHCYPYFYRTLVVQGAGSHFCVGANHYHDASPKSRASLAVAFWHRHESMR
eukprot:7387893-Prymnesium_polylepis.1